MTFGSHNSMNSKSYGPFCRRSQTGSNLTVFHQMSLISAAKFHKGTPKPNSVDYLSAISYLSSRWDQQMPHFKVIKLDQAFGKILSVKYVYVWFSLMLPSLKVLNLVQAYMYTNPDILFPVNMAKMKHDICKKLVWFPSLKIVLVLYYYFVLTQNHVDDDAQNNANYQKGKENCIF